MIVPDSDNYFFSFCDAVLLVNHTKVLKKAQVLKFFLALHISRQVSVVRAVSFANVFQLNYCLFLKVGWVLRYSGLVKCRGIIHTKGYIVKLIRNTQGYNFSPQ